MQIRVDMPTSFSMKKVEVDEKMKQVRLEPRTPKPKGFAEVAFLTCLSEDGRKEVRAVVEVNAATGKFRIRHATDEDTAAEFDVPDVDLDIEAALESDDDEEGGS